jgi:hypothetical protein
MWLGWPSPARFWDAAFDAAGRLAQPYMAFAVRSDTECATLLERFMASLAGDDRATELCFATPSEALQMMGLMVA